MFLTEVVPLTKIPLPSQQILTYFTSQELQEGSLVLIPLRKKEVPAIVLLQREAEPLKMEIKKIEFKLKPILKVIKKERVLFPYQIKLAHWISNYYWAPLGKTLSLFLPKFLLKKLIRERKLTFPCSEIESEKAKDLLKKLYFAPFDFLPEEEIKMALRDKKQILFLIPEKQKSNFWIKKLRGITNDICFFSTDLPAKEYLENLKKIRGGEIKIVVGTRSALFAPFFNLGLIVLSEEESENYKSESEPRFNARKVAEKLVEILKIKLILLSTSPLIESWTKFKREIIKEGEERLKKIIIDMRRIGKISKENTLKEWSPLSPYLLKEIEKNIYLGKKSLLFLNRRGEATALLCQDCGWIKKCENCEAPLVYHFRKKVVNNRQRAKLICHHCNFKTEVPTLCENCKSWRLITLGIGLEKIEKELKEKFENAKILRLDSQVAPKRLSQRKIIKEFLKKEGAILITTSLLFQHLLYLKKGKKVPLVGLISLDSLLSLPDFRTEEKAIKIIQKLFFLCGEKFVFQTFRIDTKIIKFINTGYLAFLKEVLKEREGFFYPPFSTLAKLTLAHRNPKTVKRKAYELKKELESAKSQMLNFRCQILGPAPSFIPKIKGRYKWKMILKLEAEKTKLKTNLLSVIPHEWKIDVDPIDML